MATRKPYQKELEKVECPCKEVFEFVAVMCFIISIAFILSVIIAETSKFIIRANNASDDVAHLYSQVQELRDTVSDLQAKVNNPPSSDSSVSKQYIGDQVPEAGIYGAQLFFGSDGTVSTKEKGWLCTHDIPNNRWGCEQNTDDPRSLGLKNLMANVKT